MNRVSRPPQRCRKGTPRCSSVGVVQRLPLMPRGVHLCCFVGRHLDTTKCDGCPWDEEAYSGASSVWHLNIFQWACYQTTVLRANTCAASCGRMGGIWTCFSGRGRITGCPWNVFTGSPCNRKGGIGSSVRACAATGALGTCNMASIFLFCLRSSLRRQVSGLTAVLGTSEAFSFD